jgi:hypothetical protein
MFVNIKYLGVGLLILLIVFLIVISILVLRTKSQTITFPPEITDCPDYWYESYDKSTGKGKKCYNAHQLGSNECAEVMDFTTPDWTGSDSLCKKQTWANNCGLSWDGITNINHCN